MKYTREDLKKLSLVELKVICKDLHLIRTGTKSELVKIILEATKPEPTVVSIPKEYKPPKGKKVIGLKLNEQDKLSQIGRLREKGKVVNLYYSMGVHYYLVDKDFEFI